MTVQDPRDELFESDFENTARYEPLPPFPVKSPDHLPPIAFDFIANKLGIDLSSDDISPGEKIAANEWFWRRQSGQKVTFNQVLWGGAAANIVDVEPVDPTGTAAAAHHQPPLPLE